MNECLNNLTYLGLNSQACQFLEYFQKNTVGQDVVPDDATIGSVPYYNGRERGFVLWAFAIYRDEPRAWAVYEHRTGDHLCVVEFSPDLTLFDIDRRKYFTETDLESACWDKANARYSTQLNFQNGRFGEATAHLHDQIRQFFA